MGLQAGLYKAFTNRSANSETLGKQRVSDFQILILKTETEKQNKTPYRIYKRNNLKVD